MFFLKKKTAQIMLAMSDKILDTEIVPIKKKLKKLNYITSKGYFLGVTKSDIRVYIWYGMNYNWF